MWVLALIAIIIGILTAAFEHKLWFDPLTWFVLAISLELLFGGFGWPISLPGRNRTTQQMLAAGSSSLVTILVIVVVVALIVFVVRRF